MKNLKLNLFILRSNNANDIYNICKKEYNRVDLDRAVKKIILLNDSSIIYKMMMIPGVAIDTLINALYNKKDSLYLIRVALSDKIPFSKRIITCRMVMKLNDNMECLYEQLLETSSNYVDNILNLGLVNIDKRFGVDKKFILDALYKNELKYISAIIIYEDYLNGYSDGVNLDDYYSSYLSCRNNSKRVLKK